MSAADVLKLCDEVLAASQSCDVTSLPWVNHDSDDCTHRIFFDKQFGESVVMNAEDLDYATKAANTAPALAEYIRRLHSAAVARGIDIDTWDLPRQPR